MIYRQKIDGAEANAPTANGVAQPLINFPSLGLLLAFAAFVAYGSLLPLDLRTVDLGELALRFQWLSHPAWKFRSLTDWTTNVAIFIPLGFFGAAALAGGGGSARAIWTGLATLAGCISFSLGIECAQVFFPPRDSSMLDVAANTLGAALGIVGWLGFGSAVTEVYRAVVRRHDARGPANPSLAASVCLLGGCGLLIAVWGGFFTTRWTGWGGAIAHWQSVGHIPFVQHQAASIGLALASTVFALLAYAPLGAVIWVLGTCAARPLRTRLAVTAMVAAAVALAVEAAKLFMAARNPDTGNLFIAGIAGALGYGIAPQVMSRLAGHGAPADPASSADPHAPSVLAGSVLAGIGLLAGRAVALASAAAACAIATTYPVAPVLLGFALFAYAAVLTRYPAAWLLVLPALLPVLDLAPWSGRFFIDEFDGFVLATLAVGMWQAAGRPLAAAPGRLFWLLTACFTFSYLASAVIGLLPLQPWDASAMASHHSHYAALHLSKGLIFAVGLAVLISSHQAAGLDAGRRLATGMVAGLAAATLSVIWERLAYAGLADFDKAFRVVGMFSTMNTGGSHLDAYLLTTLPFVAAWGLGSKRYAIRIVATLLFATGAYAVMMTFSRAAIATLMFEILAIAAWAFVAGRWSASRPARSGVWAIAGVAVAGMVIAPALLGTFMQSRLAGTGTDMGIRASHWSDTIRMMSDSRYTTLFGMGLGRYPETYRLLSPDKDKPALHRFETESGNSFLRIHHGSPLYVEQIVAVEPQRDYKLLLKARTQGRGASVNVLLCDRTFLGGFGCRSATFALSGKEAGWQLFQATLNSATVGENRMRTARLSLENASPDTDIDLDEVALIDSEGGNHIANGSFQAGADRWFFSSPFNHLPWHIKNLWLEIFFEQGWFGLLTFFGLVVATATRLAMLARQGQTIAAMLLTALLGFLGVGAFDSLFDAPRLTLVFGLLVATAGIAYAQTQPAPAHNFSGVEAVPRIMTAFNGRNAARDALLGMALLAVSFAVITRLPFMPYNARELLNPYHPILAPILFSAFVFWVFGMPAVAARWLTTAGVRGAVYPLLVAGHGLIGWGMLQFAVLPESVHDVIGSPVLQWPWQTEYIARFVPLLSVLSVQLTAGVLLAAAIRGSRMSMAPIWWFVSAALLFPLQYWVIVIWAATDNLTELMAANASVGAFLLLSCYLALVGINGSLMAALRSGAGVGRVGFVLASLIVSLPLGYLLLSHGTEATIIKEQKVFSALQFLLSTDRDHYATGADLWSRFAVAHFAAVFVTALAQYPFWAGFQLRSPYQRSREPK